MVFLPKPFPHLFKVITCVTKPLLRGRRQSTLLCSVLQPSGFWLVQEGWQQPRVSLETGCCSAAQTHPATPGESWLCPCFLLTDVLAGCCRFMSANPTEAVGPGLEDYQGENSVQMGLEWTICCCCSPASTKPTISCGQDSSKALTITKY